MTDFYKIEKEEKKESDKLNDLGQEDMKCVDCGVSSVLIQKVKDMPIVSKLKLECFCGGSSFVKTVSGKFYLAAKEGFYIENILYNKDKTSIIKVKK